MTDTVARDQQLLEEFREGLEKDGPIVLASRVAELEQEVDRQRQRADDAEAARDKAKEGEKRAKAKVADAPKPASPRKLKAMDQDADDRAKVQAAIAEADGVEIAFSDGEREIAGIAPKLIDGETAWRRKGRDLVLAEPLTIEGPDAGTSVEIKGFALLIDGKQVGWCARAEPLRVAPGQRVQVVDDIHF